uniref:Guanylate cyclase domain-containing protein n=1 Tax=Chaetoceros debilis TaxID=122233 RepID=A0A7S3Q0D2_9STRA
MKFFGKGKDDAERRRETPREKTVEIKRTPTSAILLRSKTISRRYSIEKTPYCQPLAGQQRGISPGTKKRMEVALGLAEDSIMSSPAVLLKAKPTKTRGRERKSSKSCPDHSTGNTKNNRCLTVKEIELPKNVVRSISRRNLVQTLEPDKNNVLVNADEAAKRLLLRRLDSLRQGELTLGTTEYSLELGRESSKRNGQTKIRSSQSAIGPSRNITLARLQNSQTRRKSLGITTSSINNNEGTSSMGLKTAEETATSVMVFRRKSNAVKSNVKIPKGEVTIVITDIQDSTMMWEQDPVAMRDALDLHDRIMRKCYCQHNGYEITTEGDSFHLAFHHALDALSFCLQCQIMLNEEMWSDSILKLDGAKKNEDQKMYGLRVRMGVHHGLAVTEIHKVTQRTHFRGETIELAKATEATASGGQIVLTLDTWRTVSGMAERYLGSPQVIDLGMHELSGKNDESYLSRLVQLVPQRLSFDYFTYRGMRDLKDTTRLAGRTFPPIKTKRQISNAFEDAPYADGNVAITFAHTNVDSEDLSSDKHAYHVEKIAGTVRNALKLTDPPGYECQEDGGVWMLAFHNVGSAVTFGIDLIEKLESAPADVKIGIHYGQFTSMGPHKVTGRADYFGPVVNRSARIAATSEKGQLRLGIPKNELRQFRSPAVRGIKVDYIGIETLKGVNVEMSLFAFRKA